MKRNQRRRSHTFRSALPGLRLAAERLERRMLLTAVVSVDPAANSLTADAAADVVVVFDAAIDPTTATTATLVAQTAQRGLVAAGSVNTNGTTVTLNPDTGFFAGELITVTATSAIQDTGGEPNATRTWQFRAGVSASLGEFNHSGQTLGDHYSTGAALGDLDGDGDLDAFVSNLGSSNRIWLNTGGEFSDSGQLLGNHASYGASLGDFDSDGDLDAFVSNNNSNRIWLNDGSGTFSDSGQLLGNHDSNRAAVGDLDGDGDLDAYVVNYGQPNRIWRNENGVFTDSGQLLGDHRSFDLGLGDLDGDGDLDAFVANVDEPNRVWLNDGGEFTESSQQLSNEITFAVAIGDLDNDGDLDVYSGNSGYQGDTIWLNDGSAVFVSSGQSLANHLTQAVALGDLDGDGDLDAYTGTGGNYDSHVWINDGGVFTDNGQALIENAPTLGIALGDVDSDGDLDAFVANFTEPNAVWINEQALPNVSLAADTATVSEGGSGATLTIVLSEPAAKPVTVALEFSGSAEIGVDYLVSGAQVVIPAGSPSGEVSITVLQDEIGEPDETVIVEIAEILNGVVAGDQRQTITIVDDADPRLEVLSVFPTANSHGASHSAAIEINFDQPVAAATADFDTLVIHSGLRGRIADPAAAMTIEAARLTVETSADFFPGEIIQGSITTNLLSSDGDAARQHYWQFRAGVTSGSGAFEDSGQEFGSDRSASVSLGDIDNDGDLDAFVTNVREGNRVLVNDGGAMTDSGQSLGAYQSLGAALGDLDGDGDLDAFVANYFQGNLVWRNDNGVFVDTLQGLGNHSSTRVALGDLDGDGDLDAFVANYAQPNRIWWNGGGGAFTDSGQLLGDHTSYGVALGDIDSDGDLDAFVANIGQPNRVWINENARFVDSGQTLGNHLSAGVELGDLDGDGDLDAFVTNLAQGSRIWENDGGAFTDSGQSLDSGASSDVALGDVDGDGDLDALVATGGQANRLWRNDGGRFVDSGQGIGDHATAGIALGDLDSDGDLDAVAANYYQSNRVWLNIDQLEPELLTVSDLTPTPSGFRIAFGAEYDPVPLNLFDTQIDGLGPPDVTLHGSVVGPVAGSLILEPVLGAVTFVKSGEPLEPDTYTVTLRSADDAFKDLLGQLLDGDEDGLPGGDFAAVFTVGARANDTRIVSIPDFVRGPGQPVNLPANAASGIPLVISDATGVRSAVFELHFDAALLNISGIVAGPDLPAGATVAVDTSAPGVAVVTLASDSDLVTGSQVLAHLVADIPAADASNNYGRQQMLALEDVELRDAALNSIPVISDYALHLVSFFADVSGNGRINASDASQVARFAALLDSGFGGALSTDPFIVGDVSGNARINAADASRVARFAALISVPEIPPLPGGVIITGQMDAANAIVGVQAAQEADSGPRRRALESVAAVALTAGDIPRPTTQISAGRRAADRFWADPREPYRFVELESALEEIWRLTPG